RREPVLHVHEGVGELAVVRVDQLDGVRALAFAAHEVLAAPILRRRRSARESNRALDDPASGGRRLLGGGLAARPSPAGLAFIAGSEGDEGRRDQRSMRAWDSEHDGTLETPPSRVQAGFWSTGRLPIRWQARRSLVHGAGRPGPLGG